MLQVEHYFLRLWLQIVLKLLVAYLTSPEKLSHIMLQFDNLESKAGKWICSEGFLPAYVAFINTLDISCALDKDVKGKEDWRPKRFQTSTLLSDLMLSFALTCLALFRFLFWVESEWWTVDGLLRVSHMIYLLMFFGYTYCLVLIHKLNDLSNGFLRLVQDLIVLLISICMLFRGVAIWIWRWSLDLNRSLIACKLIWIVLTLNTFGIFVSRCLSIALVSVVLLYANFTGRRASRLSFVWRGLRRGVFVLFYWLLAWTVLFLFTTIWEFWSRLWWWGALKL